jgi:hypothetical protein
MPKKFKKKIQGSISRFFLLDGQFFISTISRRKFFKTTTASAAAAVSSSNTDSILLFAIICHYYLSLKKLKLRFKIIFLVKNKLFIMPNQIITLLKFMYHVIRVHN